MTTISTVISQTLKDEPDLTKVDNILTKLFLIFPHYCFGRGLFDLSTTYQTNIISLRYIPGYVPKSPLQFDIVGRNIMCLSIEGFVFFIFAICVQYRVFISDRICVRTSKNLISSNEDENVAAERQRIYADHNNINGDVLRIIDLLKLLKKICIGVKQGECFGLLGINGSGKSTTFKMLTGEISMTNGNAFVNNYSVIKQLDDVHQNLGYCPQFDALDSLLTAREHLYFYARLHGIKRKNISSEPTTGMDARAKRFLWNCILTLTRKDHKSIVITSHSMEECETLCNRLVIMVTGEFKCLGSVQHLKAKFGHGYSIIVRSDINCDTKNIINYIKERIVEVNVKEEHTKMIHFRVSINVPLYELFSVLEKAQEELRNIIEDYTVTQVTRDDVFVNFAKIQEDNQSSKNINTRQK
ncbi:unnamed protein product [Rotaria sp. Silwood1]|nr:unnamed protein product [Rotaria sp. Silwood1]